MEKKDGKGITRREAIKGLAGLAGLVLLADAVAARLMAPGQSGSIRFGPGGDIGRAASCSETYDCTQDQDGTCTDRHDCSGEMFGCTRRKFTCRAVFTCSGPGGGHNCTFRVKFFCEDSHSCSPESHYHNCPWPHHQPLEPIPPEQEQPGNR